jgi:hypothetical protein
MTLVGSGSESKGSAQELGIDGRELLRMWHMVFYDEVRGLLSLNPHESGLGEAEGRPSLLRPNIPLELIIIACC